MSLPVGGSTAQDFTTKCCHHDKEIPILSIDGGGIRGLIPGIVLSEIKRVTREKIANLFKLTVGTSTGSIYTLGLNVPREDDPTQPKYTVDDIVELYEKKGERIFPDYYCKDIWDKFRPKYDRQGLTDCLEHYMGNTKMSQAINHVAVSAYDIENTRAWTFKRNGALGREVSEDFYMKDVVEAATSAPTYFPPKQLGTHAFIDGGTFATNPARVAYFVAEEEFNHYDNYLFCSLGTGKNVTRISYDDSKTWGELKWLPNILDVMFDAQCSAVHTEMKSFYPSEGNDRTYFRFQTDLDPENSSLDNASASNIKYLRDLGEQIVEDQEEELRLLCDKLLKINGKEGL